MLALGLSPVQRGCMMRKCLPFLLAGLAATAGLGGAEAPVQLKQVVVIPIHDEIAEPTLFILRRGLKEAIARHADLVVLDVKTPGGSLDVTLQMMEALTKYSGHTIAFVDNEAASAGAFISASTDDIWFAPDGVIGAAAPVTETGQDIDATMKLKVVSYLKARLRADFVGKGNRSEVISAMVDADTEPKIGDHLLKSKGTLLSLTATEAMESYGDPPHPLLGAGIARDVPDLLAQKFGSSGYAIDQLQITWSEHLAVYLTGLAPIFLGVGLFALFLEFKTGGFGFFGFAGAALLVLVFLSSYVAGLSGHEPLVLFGLGVILLALELVFFHTAGFLGAVGVAFILSALLWTMADIWPSEPMGTAWSADTFARPLMNLALGLAIAVALAVALMRFLPKGWFWDRLIVRATDHGAAQLASAPPGTLPPLATLVGRRGLAATALRPGGQIVIEGRRYEASIAVGSVDRGRPVRVCGQTDFGLVVEKVDA
jgi:membrane-bound serine protease (ClpP class)